MKQPKFDKDIFIYNLVRAAHCSYKEANEMPFQRALFYIALAEEEGHRRDKMIEDAKRKSRGRRY